MNTRSDAGHLIRQIRKEQGISIRQFEKLTGIARGNISKIETGKVNVTLSTLDKIAYCLNRKVEIFFKK